MAPPERLIKLWDKKKELQRGAKRPEQPTEPEESNQVRLNMSRNLQYCFPVERFALNRNGLCVTPGNL